MKPRVCSLLFVLLYLILILLSVFLTNLKMGAFDTDLASRGIEISALILPFVQVMAQKLQFGKSELAITMAKGHKHDERLQSSLGKMVCYALYFVFILLISIV
jgi:hypothetical protein